MQRLTSFLLLLCSGTLTLAQTDCPNPHDSNSDGAVNISDLLDLLGLFGDIDTDQDGIWDSVDDCVDTTACNYAADPSEGCAFADALGDCGGGCEGDSDGDGICDDEDDCFGIVDACGICNGPGPTEVVIDEITILYDSVYAEQINQWFVFEVGADTTFSYECTPAFNCGDLFSYQGYAYNTIQIGDQCWFAENLRSENYANGDSIHSMLSETEWESTVTGAVAVYGEGNIWCYDGSPIGNPCDEVWSINIYGRLYNWYAVDDSRGLCPSGWHIPTDGDYSEIVSFLGGAQVAGNQMKTTYGWFDGGNGSNSSGFSGFPNGYRRTNGWFDNAGENGFLWTSSPSGTYAWSWRLDFYRDDIGRYQLERGQGQAVRCVMNTE